MATPQKSNPPAKGNGNGERRIFGTDGVRGTANIEPVTAETALKLGRAAAHIFAQLNEQRRGNGRQTIVIVVSEETGVVSLCHRGVIERNFEPESFGRRLAQLFALKDENDPQQLAGKNALPGARPHPVVGHQKEPRTDHLAF